MDESNINRIRNENDQLHKDAQEIINDDQLSGFINMKGDSEDSNSAQNLFTKSQLYQDNSPRDIEKDIHPMEGLDMGDRHLEMTDNQTQLQAKRKLTSDAEETCPKILKLDSTHNPMTLDEEVSKITAGAAIRKILPRDLERPSTSRARTPTRSSPRKITKRSNSTTEVTKAVVTPKKPKSRPASVDITSKTLQKKAEEDDVSAKDIKTIAISSDSQRSSIKFVKEIPTPKIKPSCGPILEENPVESQSHYSAISLNLEEIDKIKNSSEPILIKDRSDIIESGILDQTRSEGYDYSDLSSNLSQPRMKDYKDKNTDQESTDSVGSIIFDSPDYIPTVASKLISKLSNGDSSTPTEQNPEPKHGIISLSDNESENTPDMIKFNGQKGKRAKNESFSRVSNNTTPSTISPLPNGHSLPMNTPQIPTFDIQVSQNEDGEFLSLYIVRTDNDLGMDMCKEYQRFSKRFTIDPYLADVSVNNSPSSVTSTGVINLPNRISFASTVSSSSSSSNRTSDGAFVVPQPPRKSVSNPGMISVKGCEAVMKKLHDVFSHIRDSSIDDGNRTASEEKVSIGIQVSPMSSTAQSNGNASPEEVSNCDKVTPKSSLKKTRVRGRRPLTGKTKRAILPTQVEELEYMHGMNSPEMVNLNGDTGKTSPIKSPKEEKPNLLVATPKSVNKLKQKRSRPTSPRPATPVEKIMVKSEYPGYAPDTVVLAKWVDKRYYSGRVLEITEPNKYLIKFDDGQSKALLDDFIIFGNMRILPLQGQSVYAMVDEDQNYEPVLVLGVEENDSGTVIYRCTTDGDSTVCVTASELYLTEDQARSLKESVRPRSPSSGPTTPRRRGLRELDLDNIIQGPRSARTRDKGNSSARKRVASPKSPKASTSGVKSKITAVGRKRLASESSEMSESSNSAPPVRLEEVAGVEPEVQRTPRKIDGVKAGPLQLKGATKQNIGKKNSKLTKFENDEDTNSQLGPIPAKDSKLFADLHFLLTCTEPPKRSNEKIQCQETRHYSSEEDGESTSTMAGTDCEEMQFSDRPFNKERLKEQLEAGGGTVYSHFDDVPKNKYSVCKLIAPRPCLTAKYIQCVAADIRALSHVWVILSCIEDTRKDYDSYCMPAGWSILKEIFVNWCGANGKRNTSFFKDKIILLCGDQDTFVKFWERVCSLSGAITRVVNEEDLNMSGALALVTEWDCPHEVQNKANQDNIPLVSTTWVVQCLIEGRIIGPTAHDKFSFMYTEPE